MAFTMDRPTDPVDNHDPPRKLSRPRSLLSSAYLLKRLEQHQKTLSSLTPSTSYEFGDYPTFARSKSRGRSARLDACSKLRAYLHGSRNSNADASDDDDEGQRGLPGIAKGVKHRLSRVGTASSTPQLSSAGASTSQLSSYSTSHLDVEDSARVAEEIKEKAYIDQMAALNHVSCPIDEDMHVDSVPTPIRRKSLYTPGIATRTPNDILRKPPPPQILQSQAERDHYFNPNLTTSSPVARSAVLEVVKSGRSTPNLDYSHLGGLGLGTLRVTNGSASPKPQEVLSHPSHPETSHVVDEAQGMEASVDEKIKAKVPVAGSTRGDKDTSIVSKSTLPPNNESNPSKTTQGGKRDTEPGRRGRRSGSPLQHEHKLDDKDPVDTSSRTAHSKWLNRKQSLPSGFFATPSDPASAMALQYLQIFSDTPTQRPKSSGGGSFKSRRDSNSDELHGSSFEDEGLVMSKSYRSALEMWRSFVHDVDHRKPNNGTREDAYRKLNTNSTCYQSNLSRPTSSSASAKTMDLRSISTDPSTLRTSKTADSGYSSSDSLPLSNKTPMEDVVVANSLPGTSRANSMKSLRPSGPRNIPPSFSRKATANKAAPSFDKQNVITPSAVALVQPVSMAVPSTGPNCTIPDESTVSQPLILPPRSMPKPRKLEKPRPLSQPLPVNFISPPTRELSQSHIPEVPKDIAQKHAERLHKFPLLEHTFPSSQHINSDESLLLEPPKLTPIRFPSPAQSLERADSICNADLDWPSSRRNKSKKIKPSSKSTSRNSSTDGRRSSQTERIAAITDFGSVTECLGSSPYDIASSASLPSGKRSSMSHPHQISTSIPRAKSFIGLTSESASHFAKLRARFSNESFSKPLTLCLGSLNGREKLICNPVRPDVLIIDAPPVPAIPAEYSIRDLQRDIPQPSDSSCQKPVSRQELPNDSKSPRHLGVDAQAISTMPAKNEAVSKCPDTHRASEPRRKSFNDRSGVIGRLVRPQSTYENAPPMPVLPSKSQLEQIEAQVSGSNRSKANPATPSLTVQELPEKAKDAVDKSTLELVERPEVWKCHREAWSQRRKSAGAALLLRAQIGKPSQAPTTLDKLAGISELCKPTLLIPQNSWDSPTLPATPSVIYSTSPLRHISQSHSRLRSEGDSTACNEVWEGKKKAPTSTPAKSDTLAGRFAGGFQYGYEPGCGLGGSAGTRVAQSRASRKGINVSSNYGLDLSDVPIFLSSRSLG